MNHWDDIIEAAKHRRVGRIISGVETYVTKGGTYIIATSPAYTDDLKPHDLVVILPGPLNGTRVVPLRPNVNDRFVEALQAALDSDTAEEKN